MRFNSNQFAAHIGSLEHGGRAAGVGRDPKGYLAFGPYASLPQGHQLAFFDLAVDNVSAFNDEIAVLDIVGGGGVRLGGKILTRHDFRHPHRIHTMGVPFYNPGYRDLQFRVYWMGKSYMRFHGVTVIPSSVSSSLIQPLYGVPRIPFEWIQVGTPKQVNSVWLDPQLAEIRDTDNVRLFDRHQEALWNIGRVCGLAFEHASYDVAKWRFHYGTPATVEMLSRKWNAQEWFGSPKYASVYLAVDPNKRDLWTGSQLKNVQGGGRIGRINALRFPQHALMVAWGWAYHDQYAPVFAGRCAYMSGAYRYNDSQVATEGLAGHDAFEIGWLQKHFGKNWLHCNE